MVDLHFTDRKNLKQFNCDQCAEQTKKQRKCQEIGFDNLKVVKQVDEYGTKVHFCPGKATWYEHIVKLYQDCKLTYHTGILPKAGGMENQSSDFVDALYVFSEKWENRKYIKTWQDVHEFTEKIFQAISKMFGGK